MDIKTKIVETAEGILTGDVVVYGGSERDKQENFNIWETTLTKRDIEMHTESTKITTIEKTLEK